ncbi:sensor histidine kinase [Actinomyces vulturis]|uniref:sensor histidine kinase n=1 Tax=Actinomyces vulturis TaxID=1857645 RepID=UPI00082BFD65|nr:HAMP domain-containing sensor histidine kinase [Actinomyces vulturis]
MSILFPKRQLRLNWHWRRLPLTARLTVMTTMVLTAGLAISSAVVTSMLYTHLLGQVDTQLTTTAEAIGNQTLPQLKSGESETMLSTYYVHADYLDGHTDTFLSDRTAGEYGFPHVREVDLTDISQGPRTISSNLPHHQWRVITGQIMDSRTGKTIGTVVIGLPLTDIMETVERTRLVVAMTGLAVVMSGAIISSYLVQRNLQPLRNIESVAGRIASGDLSARVDVSEPVTTEVGGLQRSLNSMLAQIEQAFDLREVAQQRMQRFVSDASHELRTPLATMRGYGELYRMGGVPEERTGEVMGRIEAEATRMGRLVEDLLRLARMDEGHTITMRPVDMTALAVQALIDLSVLAPDRDSAVVALDGVSDAPSITVMGDQDRLSQVLTNLIGNILRYTPEDSPVEIALGKDKEMAIIEIRDHGPGVSPADMERVFERFYRSDSSRNRETGGSGLGLAIVATIIEMHHGHVSMQNTPGGGATVRILLPLAEHSPTV